MMDTHHDQSVEAVRRFSRFYTKRIGVLHEGLLGSQFSLTEARVLYELAQREAVTAVELQKELALDAGYLSRILKKFGDSGLIGRRRSDQDGRQNLISLTEKGRESFTRLNSQSQSEVSKLLEQVTPGEQNRLVEAMRVIETLLGGKPQESAHYILRPHQPGDIGWVIHRHGILYWQEYGWDETFEALVAEIAAQFLKSFDPRWERCWIAEKDGEKVGSVFLARESEETAKLRLLLVEPAARGLGIGTRLVDECIRFARQKRYRTLSLWTNSVLVEARRLYQRAGFQLVKEEPHHSFGHDLIGQHWELKL